MRTHRTGVASDDRHGCVAQCAGCTWRSGSYPSAVHARLAGEAHEHERGYDPRARWREQGIGPPRWWRPRDKERERDGEEAPMAT